MFRLSPEHRQRADFIESLQGEMTEYLATAEAKEHLSEYVEPLATVAANIFVPNIRGDKIKLPKKYRDTDGIPVVAMNKGEIYRLDRTMASMTPHQTERIRAMREIEHDNDISSEALILTYNTFLAISNKIDPLLVELGSEDDSPLGFSAAETSRTDWDNFVFTFKEAENVSHIIGRPAVALDYSLSTDRALANLVGIHELEHVVQAQENPIRSFDPAKLEEQSYRDELEAYHVQAMYGACLYLAKGRYHKDPTVTLLSEVELLRQEHADPNDPFFPTKGLRDAINKHGLDYKFIPS